MIKKTEWIVWPIMVKPQHQQLVKILCNINIITISSFLSSYSFVLFRYQHLMHVPRFDAKQ